MNGSGVSKHMYIVIHYLTDVVLENRLLFSRQASHGYEDKLFHRCSQVG